MPHAFARHPDFVADLFQCRTPITVQAEAPFDRLLQVAEDMEIFGAPRTPQQRLDELGRVTPDTVRAFLKAYPLTGRGTLVSVGPRGELALDGSAS